MDPTKGAWKEHKAIVRKIYHALERLRIELYFEVKGPNIMADFDNAEDALWHLQGQFKDYCDELEHAPCQITRMCALFMKKDACLFRRYLMQVCAKSALYNASDDDRALRFQSV